MTDFVYNVWVFDTYGKPFFYTQCLSSEAAEKRRAEFTAVYPRHKYDMTLVTMLPYQYRLFVWEYNQWEDYHEKYAQAVEPTTKKKRTKKSPQDTPPKE